MRRLGATGLALGTLTALLTLGCGESFPPTSEGLYMAKCSRCHEADGSSTTASEQSKKAIDLRGSFFQKNVGDAEIREIMEYGTGRMQGISGLVPAEVDSILLHVRRLGGRRPAFLDNEAGSP